MQQIGLILLCAFALLAVVECGQNLPAEDGLHHYPTLLIEQLEDSEKPLNPGQVHDLLVKLNEHYNEWMWEDQDQLSADEKDQRRHYQLLAELAEVSEAKCNPQHVAGMLVLSGVHAKSHNLAQYIEWASGVQMGLCEKLGLAKQLQGVQLANALL